MTAIIELSQGATLEMKKKDHIFDHLNGTKKETEQYISVRPFGSQTAIEEALKKHTGSTLMAMSFNNEHYYHKDYKTIKEKLMPHMTVQAIVMYFNAEDAVEKDKIITKVIELLEGIHTSHENVEKVQKLVTLAETSISSTRELLKKVKKPDQTILKRVNDCMQKVEQEKNADHVNADTLTTAIQQLETASGELIGSAEIAAAKQLTINFIADANKILAGDDIPDGLQQYFAPKFERLTELTAGKNPYAVQNEVELLSKELHEKTSKEILMKDASFNFVLGTMTRISFQKLFKISETTFAAVLQKIATDRGKTGYEQYLKSLGRLGKSSGNQSEVYAEIILYAFTLTISELVKVAQGQKDLSVTDEIPQTILTLVDKMFSDIQATILNLKDDDLLSDETRFKASDTLLKDMKTALRTYLKNDANLNDSDIKVLVDGPMFELTLKGIPRYVSQSFSAMYPSKKEAVTT